MEKKEYGVSILDTKSLLKLTKTEASGTAIQQFMFFIISLQ